MRPYLPPFVLLKKKRLFCFLFYPYFQTTNMSPLNTKSSRDIKITPHRDAETGEMNVIKVEVKPEGKLNYCKGRRQKNIYYSYQKKF